MNAAFRDLPKFETLPAIPCRMNAAFRTTSHSCGRGINPAVRGGIERKKEQGLDKCFNLSYCHMTVMKRYAAAD